MLEAQIIIKGWSNGVANPGDVLLCALPGFPWGTRDRIDFLVVEWDDPELEARLRSEQTSDDRWPVAIYPYMAVPAHRGGSRLLPPQMAKLSTETIDLSQSPALKDTTVEKPILSVNDYSLVAVSGGGILGTITGAIKAAWTWLVN